MIGVVKSVLLIVQNTRGKEILTLISKEHVTKLSKECSTLQNAKPKISDFDFFKKICNSNKNTSRSETN